MAAGIAKLSVVIGSQTAPLQSGLAQAEGLLKGFGSRASGMFASLSGAGQAFGATLGSIGGKLGQLSGAAAGAASSFASLAASAGPVGIAIAAVAVAAAAGTALTAYGTKLADENQRAAISFRGLFTDAQSAATVFGSLKELSFKMPFSEDEVVGAGQRMMTLGVPVAEVSGLLRSMGNVAAGTGTKLETLAALFGKVHANGSATFRDLNALTLQGIPILDQLQAQFGANEAAIKRLASEGKIGFAELKTAFEAISTGTGRFAGIMDEINETTASGNWKEFTAQLKEFAETIGGYVLPAVTTLLRGLNNLLETVREFTIGTGGAADGLEKLASKQNKITTDGTDPDADDANKSGLNASAETAFSAIDAQRKALEEAAKQLTADTATPWQKWQEQLASYNEMLSAGLITQQTYTAAVAKAKSALDGTAKAAEALNSMPKINIGAATKNTTAGFAAIHEAQAAAREQREGLATVAAKITTTNDILEDMARSLGVSAESFIVKEVSF